MKFKHKSVTFRTRIVSMNSSSYAWVWLLSAGSRRPKGLSRPENLYHGSASQRKICTPPSTGRLRVKIPLGNGTPLACSKLGGVPGIFIFLFVFRSQVESYHV